MRKKALQLSCIIGLAMLASTASGDYEAGINAAFNGDYETAFREFLEAAEEGLDLAQYNLGILYFTGQGVDRDPEQAFKWTEKAAEQGHTNAQANLASLYFDGLGVDKDIAKGIEWSERAARGGNGDAAMTLAVMYFDGDIVDRDLVLAHAWASQAQHNDHPDAEPLLEDLEPRLNAAQLSAARRMFARWQIEF